MAADRDPKLVGRIATLRRYPVKSLAGEETDDALVEARGLRGDRLWSVRDMDGKLGSGKSTRRFRKMEGLLEVTARYDGDVPVLGFPDGEVLRGDDERVHTALSAYVGRPVTLAREAKVSHFDEGPVHLVTTSSLRRLADELGHPVDARRLRPNLVLETDGTSFLEDGWLGRRLALGTDVVLEVLSRMPRCVMANQPQVGLPADPDVLRTLASVNGSCLGVLANVIVAGRLQAGDAVRLSGPAGRSAGSP